MNTLKLFTNKDHTKCSTCSKQFQNKNQLRKHILMARPNCLICEISDEWIAKFRGKRYGTAVDFHKHVEYYHCVTFLNPFSFF